MPIADDKLKVQVTMPKGLVERIDDLAGQLHMNRSEFILMMVEENIGNEEWMIRFVSSKFMAPARALVRGFENRKQRKAKKKGQDDGC